MTFNLMPESIMRCIYNDVPQRTPSGIALITHITVSETQDRTTGNLPPTDSRSLFLVEPSYTAVSPVPEMSSDLQSAVEFLQTNNYISRIVVPFRH